MEKAPALVVFTDEMRMVLPSGVRIVVRTVVPFRIDGRVTATALPFVIVSVLLDVERVNFVVGIFLVAIARKVFLLNGG